MKTSTLPVPFCSQLSVPFFVADLSNTVENGTALPWNYMNSFRLRNWFCHGKKTNKKSFVFRKLLFLPIMLSVVLHALCNVPGNNHGVAVSIINLMTWSALPWATISILTFSGHNLVWPGLNFFRGLSPGASTIISMSTAPCFLVEKHRELTSRHAILG